MSGKDQRSIYQRVTDHIMQTMQANPDATWVMPWQVRTCTSLPQNALTGQHYRGINTVSLWCEAVQKGYESNSWATYRQWSTELGAQVRKGEKATPVVFWKVDHGAEVEVDQGEEKTRDRVIARGYHVFNSDQVEGWSAPERLEVPVNDRIEQAERFFFHFGADIRHGGGQAFYSPTNDHIQMPRFENFRGSLDYYSVLAHECGHWTAAGHRLDRDLTGRFGEDAYSAEELVAELTAAFQMAKLELCSTPRADHAHYCAHWYRLLGKDPKAIFTAAAKAQQAVDYLHQEHDRHAAKQPVAQIDTLPAQAVEPHSVSLPEERQVSSNTERSSTTMSEEKINTNKTNQQDAKAPLYELKLGNLRGNIFQNRSERGEYYSVSLFRTFTGRDGNEKVSYAIREQDIPTAIQVLEEAQKCIRTERTETKGQAEENTVQISRNR